MPVLNNQYVVCVTQEEQTTYLMGFNPAGQPMVSPLQEMAGTFNNAMDAVGEASRLSNGAKPKIKKQ